MVQYNANVHQRAPFTGVPVVEGDHSQRVTVSMPANQQVLHDLCINRLRMADPITMYINGEIVSDPSTFGLIEDEDVIVVTDAHGTAWDIGPLMQSVARSDYVAPPPEFRSRPLGKMVRHAPRERVPFVATTTSRAAFVAHPAAAPAPRAPPPPPAASPPFTATTTARSAFVAHPIEPRSPPKPPRRADAPETRDFVSTSRGAFAAPPPPPRGGDPEKPAGRSLATFLAGHGPPAGGPGTPFAGESEYDEKYVAWPLEKRAPRDAPPPPRTTPFVATTTSRAAYVAHPPAPLLAKPPQPATPKPTPFVGTTTSREAFVAHPVEQRALRRPPQKAAPTTPFTATTTSRAAFVPPKPAAFERTVRIHLEPALPEYHTDAYMHPHADGRP